MKKFKIFPCFQAIYYLFTSIWPLIHMKSFLMVTGEKTDLWLVKTVGILLLPYCLLLFYLTFNDKKNPVIILSIIFCCLGLFIIDIYYYLNGVINGSYLIDAGFQLLFMGYWLYFLSIRKIR
ncbi:hypothetical protein [Chryseobacterium geocarposphaerae]|uniref:Uncharacterized protein n=1 Tax=Chryseobacterium geocarposphaerae TaxID=1416776 RepID=A0A2M9C9A3_9FLAO|nr:hypothetical protein [Chryseobacterium geocarposphaerae]PJJ67431.1 hypothetical protein CLV73_1443 [Chryseobacterium geocarposphaerae]